MPYLASHRERKRSLWDFSSALLAGVLSAEGTLGATHCSSVAEFRGNSWRITGVVRKASSPASMFRRVLYYFKHRVRRVFNLLKFKTFLVGKVQCKQSSRRNSCQPNFLFANRVVKNKALNYFSDGDVPT